MFLGTSKETAYAEPPKVLEMHVHSCSGCLIVGRAGHLFNCEASIDRLSTVSIHFMPSDEDRVSVVA